MSKLIEVDDVVQILPPNKWAGCFLTVTEVKSWGVQGYIKIPEKGLAYYRLEHEEYIFIGQAYLVHDITEI